MFVSTHRHALFAVKQKAYIVCTIYLEESEILQEIQDFI